MELDKDYKIINLIYTCEMDNCKYKGLETSRVTKLEFTDNKVGIPEVVMKEYERIVEQNKERNKK